MADFQKRVTRQTQHGNGSFREDFLLDFSLQTESGLLGFWGIGHGCWMKGYRSTCSVFQNYSLELITEGTFELHDRSHRNSLLLHPGDLFFFGPGQRRHLQAAPEGRKFCIFFSLNPVIAAVLDRIFREKAVLHLSDLKTAEEDFLNIYRCAEANAPGTENLIFAMLEKLSAALPADDYPQPLNIILSLLENPEFLQMGRRELAAAAGIGISTLNRLFARYLGTTPVKYRRNKRLELACRLLSLQTMPLKKIAAECGFSSTPFFCREFKQLTGDTPSQYIRRRLHGSADRAAEKS